VITSTIAAPTDIPTLFTMTKH